MEQKIVASAVASRSAYDQISKLLTEEEFSDISREIWKRIVSYYNNDIEAKTVDVEILKKGIERDFPKQHELINNVIDGLEHTSTSNLLNEIRKTKKQAIAIKLAGVLASNPESTEIKDLINQLNNLDLSEKTEPLKAATSIAKDTLVELSNNDNLIKLYPKELNDRIDGGILPGNQVLIYARPNAGKSQFSINLARGLCRDGKKVLYLINEEPKKQILSRMISRFTNLPKIEVYKNIDLAVEISKQNGLDNFFIEDINPGTFAEIRGLIEEVSPDVLILDQLRNVSVRNENRVNQLETAATKARQLAKQYDLAVISVTQAGDSAHNKLVLDMGDVDFSNTGIPAQMDLMIGIGVNEDFRHQGLRMLSIAKNKLSSDHSHFPVRVEEAISKMVSA